MPSPPISFEVEATCPWSGARAGRLTTKHGIVKTPVFMPVGTNATVKALSFEQLRSCKAEIVLCNAYHLYLRPGHELIDRAGGLHRYMSWNGPILTDSGGYQVFSLDDLRTISEDGVHFKDHRSGDVHFIGPAESMKIQNALGADIIMAFDECVKNPATVAEARIAMERTHRWLDKCIATHDRSSEQGLFGIVQGSIFENLRTESAATVTSFDLPGYAIGGVAVGEDRGTIEKIVLHTAPLLPTHKPRYLMGIGTPWDIAFAIRCGIDMFDCAMPTRLARHGAAFTPEGRISLKNARFAEDYQPIDKTCTCYTCLNHSRAYLRHLVVSKEMTAASLLSMHNITCLIQQAAACREAIFKGKFQEFFENQTILWSRHP